MINIVILRRLMHSRQTILTTVYAELANDPAYRAEALSELDRIEEAIAIIRERIHDMA